MSAENITSAPNVVIPAGEKRTYVSELFAALVLDKDIYNGFTRDRYVLTVELIEQDPTVVRTAVIEVLEPDWKDVAVGDKVMIRLYQHADKTWSPVVPFDPIGTTPL
jgi:hypothetical protein